MLNTKDNFSYNHEIHLALQSDSILIFCARVYLAKQLDLQVKDLVFLGTQEMRRGFMILFNIEKDGHELNHSTRSVKFEKPWSEI